MRISRSRVPSRAVEPLERRQLLSAAAQLTALQATDSRYYGPTDLTTFAGRLFYLAPDPTAELAAGATAPDLLWSSDGTAKGTLPFDGPDGEPISGATGILAGPDALYVTAGTAVYRTNGTAAGTVALPVPATDQWTALGATAGQAYLVAGSSATDSTVWVTDGTTAGTTALAAYPFATPSDPTSAHRQASVDPNAAAIGQTLYYATGGQLFRTDGTVAGTTSVESFQSGADPEFAVQFNPMVAVGATLYFSTNDILYASDGTAAGTRSILTDVQETPQFVAAGDRVFFTAGIAKDTFHEVGNGSDDLYVTDGTAAGTVDLSSTGVVPATAVTGELRPQAVAGLGDGRVVFDGNATADGTAGLYVTDGTTTGSALLKSFGPLTDVVLDGVVPGAVGKAFISAGTGNGTLPLYRTDGTVAGTSQVATDLPNQTLAYAAGHVFGRTADLDYNETSGLTGGTAHDGPGQLFSVDPASTAGLTPTAGRSTLATAVVSGAKAKRGSVAVTVTNSTAATATGVDTVALYATATGVIDASSTLVGSAKKNLKLAAGRSATVTVPVNSLSLPDGTYTILPRVTTADGSVTDGTAGPAVSVAPATVTLAVVVGSVSPTALSAGKPITVSLTVTNTGNTDAVGPGTITLGLSADGSAVAVPFPPVRRGLTVKANGRAVALKLRVKTPAIVPTGTYALEVTVTSGTHTAMAFGTTPVTFG